MLVLTSTDMKNCCSLHFGSIYTTWVEDVRTDYEVQLHETWCQTQVWKQKSYIHTDLIRPQGLAFKLS